MTLIRTVDPAVEPVTLAEAKAHLRIEQSGEDELITGLIAAARQEVERQTGQAMIDQDWRLVLDRWPEDPVVSLDRHPVRGVLSVTIYGADGGASVLPPADYQLDPVSRPARLALLQRPRPGLAMNGIEIDFRTGYGATGVEVPDLLRRAVLMLVGHWYEFRGAYGPGDQPVAWPVAYERLIAGFRQSAL